MKKEEFFNIMNDIDNDLLAREDRASANVKKLLARKLTVLVAAVLLIAVCLSVVVPMVGEKHIKPDNQETEDPLPPDDYISEQEFIELTPELIGKMYSKSSTAESITSNYNIVHTSDIKIGTDLPDFERLPIYQIAQSSTDKKIFLDFINANINSLTSVMGLSYDKEIKADQIKEESFYSIIEKLENQLNVFCYSNSNTMEMQIYDRNNAFHGYTGLNKKILLNGSYVGVSTSDSKEEIALQLSDVISYVCKTFGKTYQNVLVEKRYEMVVGFEEYVTVYLYNEEDIALPSIFSDISISSEYMVLKFVKSHYDRDGVVPDDKAYLRSISYRESIVDYDEYYRQCGEYDMLTLGEAEEMLEKGYVFGFHACPLCAREQTGVDFTNYDYVTIVYRTGNNGIIIPFYAFYENIDKLFNIPSYMHAYAMTLVLALDIDGIDEYFEKQAQYHKSSQGGSDTLFLYNLRKSETEENCYYGYDTDGDVCRVYYEGNDVIDGQDYYVFINLFRNLDYPDGAPGEEDPLYEVNAVGVHLMEENE
mgnify:CR=1 FL=1